MALFVLPTVVQAKCDLALLNTLRYPDKYKASVEVAVGDTTKRFSALTSEDYDFLANKLSSCVPGYTGSTEEIRDMIDRFRLAIDEMTPEEKQRDYNLRHDGAANLVGAPRSFPLSEMTVDQLRKLGIEFPDLKDGADALLRKNQGMIDAGKAAERQHAAKQAEQAADEAKATDDFETFKKTMPYSCKSAESLVKTDQEKGLDSNVEEMAGLAQAGDNASACAIATKVIGMFEELRSTSVQCYHDLSGNPDPQAKKLAQGSLAGASFIRSNEVKFEAFRRELHCE